ncbi:hypothetical protein VTN00DRAFT_1317 [Thermoascus crustaceus]|uniref:uncharacterized protein n=1 Tax=Thermoascus crustaceus TaxID=5088 RepID=UPI00374382BF
MCTSQIFLDVEASCHNHLVISTIIFLRPSYTFSPFLVLRDPREVSTCPIRFERVTAISLDWAESRSSGWRQPGLRISQGSRSNASGSEGFLQH